MCWPNSLIYTDFVVINFPNKNNSNRFSSIYTNQKILHVHVFLLKVYLKFCLQRLPRKTQLDFSYKILGNRSPSAITQRIRHNNATLNFGVNIRDSTEYLVSKCFFVLDLCKIRKLRVFMFFLHK